MKEDKNPLRKVHDELEDRVRERTAELALANKVLDAINRVFREALTCETEEELGKTCLAVAEELTDSKFGFLGELNPAGLMDDIAISNPGWDACEIAVAKAKKSVINMPIRGIDRSTIRDGESRIVNRDEMATHPDRVGVPAGHPEVTAFLGVPLKHMGKTVGMIGLGNKESGYDDDDRKAVEALAVALVETLRIARAEKTLRKERLAAIGQVSGSIAHDLRNPLGSVRNAVYYLKQIVPDGESEILEYIEIIDKEVATANRIITNLLRLGRNPKVTRQEVDIARAVCESFDRMGPGAGVRLRISADPDPFVVRADPDQLRQVLDNLIGNAAQAMGGKGDIDVDATRDGQNDRIVFRNTGPGIAEEIRKTLFQPLVTTKVKGTGLGLTICRQIVERHGGTIDVADDERAGAAFVICLPRETRQTSENVEN
jgi:signal transduction histidine kinase